MSKSVYSLVLSDNVVDAVDRLAYAQGTSRSRMIDRILAEYADCDTPGKRFTDIFHGIEKMADMEQQFRLLFNQSDELLQILSSVPYKYNPNVKYAIELYADDPDYTGELRVSMRTQSAALLRLLGEYFDLWQKLEDGAFLNGDGISSEIGPGRFIRRLRGIPGSDADQTGKTIAAYIRLFDRVLHVWFDAMESGGDADAGLAAENAFESGLTAAVRAL